MTEPNSLELAEDAPQPRLCHIVKWPNFDGYGFNLHGDKNKPGQYIGKIDKNSPAETAGLQEGDRIVEVNGVNISNENHKQVVERIRTVDNETKLLVIDANGDKWYKEHNIIVKSDQSNVIFGTSKPKEEEKVEEENDVLNGSEEVIQNGVEDSHSTVSASSTDAQAQSPMCTTPSPESSLSNEIAESNEPEKTESVEEKAEESDNVSVEEKIIVSDNVSVEEKIVETNVSVEEKIVETNVSVEEKIVETNNVSVETKIKIISEEEITSKEVVEENGNDVPEKDQEDKVDSADEKNANIISDKTDSPAEKTESNNAKTDAQTNDVEAKNNKNVSTKPEKSGLNLNMTAAEMRAQLSQKKKIDPRKDSIDLKKKYQIIQNM